MRLRLNNIKVIVVTSDNITKTFIDEESALDWIKDTLENSPKCSFVMFKPYQKIEPKRRLLTDLIIKIE